MNSNVVSVKSARRQSAQLTFCGILIVMAGTAMSSATYADTIWLKANLPAQRLAQIENQMAPAKLFASKPFNQPIPTIRGRIVAVEPSCDHSQWILKVRAWWRAAPNAPLQWSSNLVAIPREAVRNVFLEFDSLYGLRFALSDCDFASSPIGSDAWIKSVLGAFDPEGRLGLVGSDWTTKPAPSQQSSKYESGLLKNLQAQVNGGQLFTASQSEAVLREMTNPLSWRNQNWGSLPLHMLYAIAFDSTYGGFEADYRPSAEKALGLLSYLARTLVREEFRRGQIILLDPREIPETERYAALVQGFGYTVNSQIFQALDLGVMEEGEITIGLAGIPDAANLGLEPSEVAFAALEVIEREPTFWLLDSSDEETRQNFADQYLSSISRLGAAAWDGSPFPPVVRRSDKRQFGNAAREQNFTPRPGTWTPLQVQARKTALRLMLPNLDSPFIQRTKARGPLRDSAAAYQKAFCNLLMDESKPDGEIAIAQFVERALIESARTTRPLQIRCLDGMLGEVTRAHGADPTDEMYAQRRRRIVPSVLILGALASGPQALFPGTDLGRQFDNSLTLILDAIRNGHASSNEHEFIRHLCAIGGYVNQSRRDWNDAAARTAVRNAVTAARTVITSNDGDLAQLKLRELVERKAPQVLPPN